MDYRGACGKFFKMLIFTPRLNTEQALVDTRASWRGLQALRRSERCLRKAKYNNFPWWLSGKEPTCQWRRLGFDPWSGKIACRKEWQPTPGFLPGESRGQRSLVGYSPWDHKESDTTERLTLSLHFNSLHLLPVGCSQTVTGLSRDTRGGSFLGDMGLLRWPAVTWGLPLALFNSGHIVWWSWRVQ